MAKSRRRSSSLKTFKDTANKVLPTVNKGLQNVGYTAKNVAKSSVPIIEKGVSTVYGTMATGLDLGVKGAKSIAHGVSKSRITRHRTISGGRRSRRRSSRTRSRRRY